ncbi:MAG: beta-lactamase family protein, partial [Bacteroidales bacterium]|nr:beta-lactamase family protein [Bacteroidales bacterium]
DMVPSSFAASVAGPNTYGHTGFTGTCAWVDPDSGIIIVFLCNRIHPSQDNKKLNTMKIRQKICNAVYGF